MAKIIKYGRRLLTTDKGEKLFICTCCDCRWIADPSEYVTIRTPMKPNAYSWCPNCGTQAWEQEEIPKDEGPSIQELIEFCEEIAQEYEERAEKYDRWDEEESVYTDYCTSYAAKHRKISEILKEMGGDK